MTTSEDGRDKVLDNEQIDGLIAAAGVEGTTEILNAFWRSSDDLLAKIKIEIAAEDFSAALRTAHAFARWKPPANPATMKPRRACLRRWTQNTPPRKTPSLII